MNNNTWLLRAIPVVKRWWWRLWILLFVVGLIFLMIYPEKLSLSALQAWVQRFEGQMWTVYIAISFARGIFLLPSTIFILLGAALFPQQLLLVAIISLVAILSSATFLYYLSEAMGLATYLEKKYPQHIDKVKHHLNRPTGLIWMVAWSFFPLVPTDLMCYIARLVGVKYRWMILAVFLGELPLVLLCVYGYQLF